MPGPAPVGARRLDPAVLAAAATPAATLAFVGLFARPGAEGVFLADATGLVAAIAFAAFSRAAPSRLGLRLLVVAVLLGVAHAAVAAGKGVPASGAPAYAVLALGASVGAGGLSALARGGGVPAPAGGAIAAGVLWLACGGLWWADALAQDAGIDDRLAVRQAVLDLDPFTAAAYGCARLDRLHDPAVYEETTIATLPVVPPEPGTTAAWWGAAGLVAGGAGLLARRLRREPEPSA